MPSDHLILSSGVAAPPEGKLFFERDWSRAWVNFLLQEVGPYELCPLERFKFEELNHYRFVYLPSSLTGKLKAPHQTSFESFVESGGTLIVEGPAANFLKCAGLRFSSKSKSFTSMTSVSRKAAPQAVAESLLQMPFKTRGWEIASQEDGLEVLLEMGKIPVLFKRSLGQGTIFTLGFDFGLLLVGLQQGIPVNGTHRLQKLFGTQARVIEPEDLVVKASLLDNSVPWADLFERFLFKVITHDKPTPRWWYFPSAYNGAVISTHDDESIGADPRLLALAEKEKAMGIRGSLFVISDGKLPERWSNSHSLRHLSQEGMEIGLHWNRFEKPAFKFRSFKLGMHEEPLARQTELLEKELGQTVLMNRTHYLALGHFYGKHFDRLRAQGFLYDSTYGPNQGGRGYLFGTGYPYYGLGWDGSVSGVLELPFLTQEIWGGADLDFLRRLIRESDENYHQCVVMNFHPHYKILQEEGRETWLGSLEFAKERRQWIPTLGEFFQFFKTRNESSLRSQFQEGTLEIRVNTSQTEGALSLPVHLSDGRTLGQVTVDGANPLTRQVLNCGFEEVLVPVPQGTHKVEVRYEK